MKIKPWFILRFAASFLLVAWLLYSIDFNEVWTSIPSHGWIYIILLFLVINADRVLMSYKWRILLKAKDIFIPFPEILKSYYIGTFWGIFMPSTIGGDVIRAFRVSKQQRSKKDIISSVVIERVLGACTGLFMSVVCLVVAFEVADVFDWRLDMGVTAVFLVVAVGFAVSFQGRIRLWLNNRGFHERQGILGKLARIYDSYRDFGDQRGALLLFAVWTLAEQCVPILGVYLTALALGKEVSFFHVAIFVPLVMTIAKVPMTLDGFGVREGLYVYLFSLVGISGDDAFAIGLISHVVANLALLPGFIYSSLHLPPAVDLPSPESLE